MKNNELGNNNIKMLKVVDDDGTTSEYFLNNRSKWLFGRKTESVTPDISVHSRIVSREHGVFECIDNEWFYIDKGSKNGTYYNDRKLPEAKGRRKYPILLNSGDTLRIDNKDLESPDLRAVKMTFLDSTLSEA